MEKEKIEKIPRKRIEVDVNKIKKIEDHFTHREITEINSGIEWYDFVFPVDLVNCETKVFVSIAERKGECDTTEHPSLRRSSIWNVAPYQGGISVLIWLGDTDRSVEGQIDILGFTSG